MNTPTPTPRTDAAWSLSFDGKQLSAGQTARSLRDCSQQLERELTALTAERDQLRADCENETKWAAHYLAQSIADKSRAEKAERAETVAIANWNGALERALKAEANLAAERARLDWLQAQEVKRGLEITEGRDDPLPFLVLGEDGKTHWGNTYRAAIDAAMKEGGA